MKLTADERIAFAQAVWASFTNTHHVRRFGMSPVEFYLVGKWMDAEIPLPIVFRGISETAGSPRTLLACEAAVQRAYQYYRSAMSL